MSSTSDGSTWTRITTPLPNGSWSGLCYGTGGFVANSGSASTSASIYISTDSGATFVAKTTPTLTSGCVLAGASVYGNGAYLILSTFTAGVSDVVTSLSTAFKQIGYNATVVSTDDITSMGEITGVLGYQFVVIGGSLGKIGSIYYLDMRNYLGVGNGPLVYNNATVLGAVKISSITVFDGTIVIGGATSRVGSFDGTNWKNYSGTGTGTGIYSSSVIATISAIVAATEFQGQYIAVGGTTLNSISSDNVSASFYLEVAGSAYVANILSRATSLTYLYVYKYENGLYLINLVNSNTNRVYVLDNVSKTVATNYGRYAVPQVSGGVTRHVITETPRYAGNNLNAISIIGYVDFLTFNPYQQYPAYNVTPNSLPYGQVGYGYADLLYTTAAGGSALYGLYGPQPLQQPSGLAYLSAVNTPTLVNGNGKLTNLFGDVPAVPFEFRVNFINEVQSYLSVAVIDGFQSDALGTMITNVGEFDESYSPQIVGDSTILYKFNGSWVIIKIGTAVTNRIQSVDGRFYKINTISPLNLVDSINNRVIVASMDYNGKMFFTSGSAPSATAVPVASVIQTGFSNSVDVGDKLVNIAGPTSANIEVFGYRIPITNASQPDYKVDTYVSDLYSFSTISDGSEFVSPDPTFPIYAPYTRLPVAIGASYTSGTAIVGKTTSFLNQNYDGYEIGNDVTGTFVPFNLFGQTYLFDGFNIYTANLQNNILVSKELTCNALGMVFIATTPTVTYFLSTFDNSLYGFQGGRNLVKSVSFATLSKVTGGAYSTMDNSLLLDSTDSLIWMRDGIISRQDKKTTQTSLKFYPTNRGLLIANNLKSWQYTFYSQVGSLPVPLLVQTAYYGIKANEKSILKEWIITLFSETKAAVSLFLTEKSKDQDAQYENTISQRINNVDWDKNGYAWIRLIPIYPRTLGASLEIRTNDQVYVLEVSAEYEDANKAVISAAKTR
jgi:hypothetical protein